MSLSSKVLVINKSEFKAFSLLKLVTAKDVSVTFDLTEEATFREKKANYAIFIPEGTEVRLKRKNEQVCERRFIKCIDFDNEKLGGILFFRTKAVKGEERIYIFKSDGTVSLKF